jgi:hypothetical protein
MGWLATFLAVLPSSAVTAIQEESFDIAPASGGTTAPRSVAATRAEILELFHFDKMVGGEFEKGLADLKS